MPIGLQYGGNAGRILVQGNGQGTRTTPDLIDTTVGLRVEPNQTLAMVGGNVALLGGTLKSAGGRIELGSVAGAGRVNLTPTNTGWALGYSGVPTFGDIQLSGQATVDASGAGGGDIQVQGRRVTLTNGSQIETSTLGAEPGGTLNLRAKESVEAIGTTADGQFSTGLLALVYSGATGAGGNLTVKTGRLIIRDGAQVLTGTFGTGAGGTLSAIASDAIEVIGTSADGQFGSKLSAQNLGGGVGDAGDLTIATGRLLVRDGAQVSTSTYGTGAGGTLSVIASDVIELNGTSADGKVGSGLYAQTQGDGNAGDLTIATGQLIVRDGAEVNVSSTGSGDAANLEVAARSIRLSNQALLSSNTRAGQGNIILDSQDLVLLGGSNITTDAQGTATGGNITIDTDIITALENSDISANAQDARGGQVIIDAQGIFGTEFRERENPATSDITATSELGPEFSATVEINTPDVDLSSGLVNLPLVTLDTEVAQGCTEGSPLARSEFIITGRGGLPRSRKPHFSKLAPYPKLAGTGKKTLFRLTVC